MGQHWNNIGSSPCVYWCGGLKRFVCVRHYQGWLSIWLTAVWTLCSYSGRLTNIHIGVNIIIILMVVFRVSCRFKRVGGFLKFTPSPRKLKKKDIYGIYGICLSQTSRFKGCEFKNEFNRTNWSYKVFSKSKPKGSRKQMYTAFWLCTAVLTWHIKTTQYDWPNRIQ